MPGDVYLTNEDYGAGYGYGGFAPTGQQQTMLVGGGGSPSHTSFVIWLLVFTLAAILVQHGLRVAGFTFLFRR